jgi:hypothetical protein
MSDAAKAANRGQLSPVALSDAYSCTPIGHVLVTLEALTAVIGPAGDVLYVPMRITGGLVTGIGAAKTIVGGSDFASMFADERLVHDGSFAVADLTGDIVFWYGGTSEAQEGAYDAILGGELLGKIPCRLSVRSVSTSRGWSSLNRRPLLGAGWFDGITGTLEFTLLSIAEDDARE